MEQKSSYARAGLLASLLRAIPVVSGLARWFDNNVMLPRALTRAGWHFGPHRDQVGKRKLLALLNGTFEGETLDVFRRVTPKNAVALDVGANFGFFSRHLSALVGPDGKVFSFEAHPEIYSLLMQNISRCANVSAFNYAASNQLGELMLNSMDNPLAHSLFATDQAAGNWTVERRIKVQARRIDEVLADVDLAGRPLVVKMDIEGAEVMALNGMAGLFARAPDVAMIVEYAPAFLDVAGTPPRSMLNWLWQSGFQIYLIEHSVAEMRNPPNAGWHTNLLCLRGSFVYAGLFRLLPDHLI